MQTAVPDVEMRRRRALYRAQHRGTKEMDFLLGKFAEAALPAMDVSALTSFEELLALPDPDLEHMILRAAYSPGGPFAGLLSAIRRFHNLADRQA